MESLQIKLDNFQTTLSTNEGYVGTYVAKFAALKDKCTTDLLPTELDEDLMKLQLSARKAVVAMKDSRSPYTKRMDEIRSMFTAQENAVTDIDKQVQVIRDNSATAELRIKRKEMEAESLLKYTEDSLRANYAQLLKLDKADVLTAVQEGATAEQLASLDPQFSQARFDELVDSIELVSSYGNDTLDIKAKGVDGKYELLEKHYVNDMKAYIAYAATLIGKKEEVVAAPVVVVAEPTIATTSQVIEKGVKAKLSLEVTSKQGWLQVIQMYFRDNSEVDGKCTLEKMRKHCEVVANKTGELLTDGALYSEIVKTSARASK